MTNPSHYPLAWPDGWPRTPAGDRKSGDEFRTASEEFSAALGRYHRVSRRLDTSTALRGLMAEIGRLGGTDLIVSTSLRKSGSGVVGDIEDPGVAIYYRLGTVPMAMACDRYKNVAANIRSLALAIIGLRQLDRHGGAAMQAKAFAGFAALPPPRSCWDVLGINPGSNAGSILAAWRTINRNNHPDT